MVNKMFELKIKFIEGLGLRSDSGIYCATNHSLGKLANNIFTERGSAAGAINNRGFVSRVSETKIALQGQEFFCFFFGDPKKIVHMRRRQMHLI